MWQVINLPQQTWILWYTHKTKRERKNDGLQWGIIDRGVKTQDIGFDITSLTSDIRELLP